MPIVERDLTYLVLPGTSSSLTAGSEIAEFTLVSGPDTHFPGFQWKLEFPLPQAYRLLITGPDRPRPPHDNLNAPAKSCRFQIVSLDRAACFATFKFPEIDSAARKISGLREQSLQLRLWWKYQVYTEVVRSTTDQEGEVSSETVVRDLEARPCALTEHGMIRHWVLDRSRLHLGLGEKAAPIDLTGRSFTLHAADSAWYDTYRTDPLYKHTPFLISTPRPTADFLQDVTYAIAHGTNSICTWDVGQEIDYPSGGWSKRFIQDWGGLEEWVMFGCGVEGVVKTFAQLAGKPRLIGRDWLGYLGSTMLLSDKPNAQELLEKWPSMCRENDIPCSAMHLSSGYTQDEETNSRWVFHMNKKRYPDFKGMMKVYHQAGMKLVPNVKPYILRTHPANSRLLNGNGLYYDPITKGPSKQNLWASGEGDGSWVDFSAPETRRWWAEGVKSLIDLGVDGMWDDNSEFYTRDDALLFKNEFDRKREVEIDGKVNTGLMGRLTSNEVMNKVSHDTLQAAAPSRRTFVLTRSGNVAAFKYACSTWSGDNLTSWHNMRGSQAIQLNSALSLLQSTGADVGGFCGDAPGPELFVRWVQLGVTHSRFCIHSNSHDSQGKEKLSTPWMYPEMLPAVRQQIKWRYKILPFLNDLMWRSHLRAEPPNAPLFYGVFSSDPTLYGSEILEGFSAWLGVGRLLTAPQVFEGIFEQRVYFPKSAADDQSLYYDLHEPHGTYQAGKWATVVTPIEHGGLFARQGAVIPIGRSMATVTALSGDPITHTDGVNVILEEQGGQVGLDNWRGVMIFPDKYETRYCDRWIEDDGISADPGTCVVKVTYFGTGDTVVADIEVDERGFTPLWDGVVFVLLPVGDGRRVQGARKVLWEGRTVWELTVKHTKGYRSELADDITLSLKFHGARIG